MGLNTAASYVNAVQAALTPLRDETRAVAMAAYMKDHFPFLGIPAPDRRTVMKRIARPEPAKVPAIARALWKRREREYHYVAVDLLDAMAAKLDARATLRLIEELALQHSWWDSIDGLAGVAGKILRRHQELRGIVWTWSSHASFWVNRLAILHQNGWSGETDQKVLFKLCAAHAHEEEFFIRKAIGWALRDYAWKNPKAVQAFVDENRDTLSKLSIREAKKNIGGPCIKTR
jgi:3-methyladenine DNA glycosylase AlkD